MKIELDEHEQATLIGLLVEAIEASKLQTSPRVKSARSILVKLGIKPAMLPHAQRNADHVMAVSMI